MIPKHIRIIKAEGASLMIVRHAMTCICGKAFNSQEVSLLKATREIEPNMIRHIESCHIYKFLRDCQMAGFTFNQILEATDE